MTIRSITHKGDELLDVHVWVNQVRYTTRHSQVQNQGDFSNQKPFGQEGYLFYTPSVPNDHFGRYCKIVGSPTNRTYMHYKNLQVPMSILDRMKAVEGDHDVAYWDRRGVEVGKESWGVLTEWASSRE